MNLKGFFSEHLDKIIIASLVTACLIFFAVFSIKGISDKKERNEVMQEAAAAGQISGQGTKLIAYNEDSNEFCTEYVLNSLKTSDPSEVGGYVRYRMANEEAGNYCDAEGNTVKTYCETLYVTIIDAQNNEAVASDVFRADLPESKSISPSAEEYTFELSSHTLTNVPYWVESEWLAYLENRR
ncbi:MAG: hypothetical protein ABFC73_06655 [Clostridiaceae bacterium]